MERRKGKGLERRTDKIIGKIDGGKDWLERLEKGLEVVEFSFLYYSCTITFLRQLMLRPSPFGQKVKTMNLYSVF